MAKKKRVRWLRVANRRNSDCSKNLKKMDWDNWWVDTSSGYFYLHVRYFDEDEETWWRVQCNHTDHPRVAMRDGVLYWLVD